MINLDQFCYKAKDLPYLHKPFSYGDWTYATNGHIAVRVPRLADAPEVPNAPNSRIELLFPADVAEATRAMPNFEWPPKEAGDCLACDSRGTKHDCPGCECPCPECAGGGFSEDAAVSGSLGNAIFNAKYLSMLMALPKTKVPTVPHQSEPMPFIFEGGRGVLMPRRGPAMRHVADPGDLA